MELLFLFLLFSVIAGVIGSRNGRSGFLWFIAGVLGGPLAIVIVLVLPKQESAIVIPF